MIAEAMRPLLDLLLGRLFNAVFEFITVALGLIPQ
jgi:hypothetical protein